MKKHHLAAAAGCWEISILQILRAGVFFLPFRKPGDFTALFSPCFFLSWRMSLTLLFTTACSRHALSESAKSWHSFSGLLPPWFPGTLAESILVVAHWNVWQRLVFVKLMQVLHSWSEAEGVCISPTHRACRSVSGRRTLSLMTCVRQMTGCVTATQIWPGFWI